ncbi:hypothetical protein I3760_13G075600 [Carya illinoinensis]|nr:hypothetical protein I3760_13G075600 [Carya illinoinensis]
MRVLIAAQIRRRLRLGLPPQPLNTTIEPFLLPKPEARSSSLFPRTHALSLHSFPTSQLRSATYNSASLPMSMPDLHPSAMPSFPSPRRPSSPSHALSLTGLLSLMARSTPPDNCTATSTVDSTNSSTVASP